MVAHPIYESYLQSQAAAQQNMHYPGMFNLGMERAGSQAAHQSKPEVNIGKWSEAAVKNLIEELKRANPWLV